MIAEKHSCSFVCANFRQKDRMFLKGNLYHFLKKPVYCGMGKLIGSPVTPT